jgi:predicted O-methyltransferase YrrM
MNLIDQSFNRIKLILKYISNPKSILEIGTHQGEFAIKLYDNFKPDKLVLVDPWKFETDYIYQKSWYGGSEMHIIGQTKQDNYYEKVKKIFNEGLKNNTVEILKMNSDEAFIQNKIKFDLIYIDGNHLYNFVLKDILNSINFLNRDGIIVCDDFNSKGWWEDGVTKAVNEIVEKKKLRFLNYSEALITQQSVLKMEL